MPRPVGSIGSRTNGIYPYAGPAGVIMNEAGSGPWEGIVSGHPGKRSRSRVITEEIARRLGGDVQWRFADGGFFGGGGGVSGSDQEAGGVTVGQLRAAMDGMQIQLTGGSALADSMAARISMARRRA